VLHSIPTSTTYEDTLQAREKNFGDQHFVAAYRSQQGHRRPVSSYKGFASAIERLAHRAYPTLSEDNIRRETGNAFSYCVRDPDINIQLLLGGEKTISEVIRKAQELHAIMVTERPNQNTQKTYQGNRSTLARRKDAQEVKCWSCGEPGHFESSWDGYPHRKRDEKLQRDKRDHRGDLNGDRIKTQKQAGTVANGRETDNGWRRRAHTGICIKAATLRDKRHHEKNDTSLVTQVWLRDRAYRVTVNTGEYVTEARPDIAAGWPEREANPGFTLQTVWGIATHFERNSAISKPGSPPGLDVCFRREYNR
jgi:hypothetical protein